ncbi:MAG: uracil-xanthine permease [Clostridia bacterium]|nr:uracil-xanthine permease [Clostridia bacterium]
MKLAYNIKDKPKFGQLIVFAFQQLLAIMAATIVVPIITNGNTAAAFEATGKGAVSNLSTVAALCGAGIGTIVYLLFTKSKSPVFLGSSFAFLGSMAAAFTGAISAQLGVLGLIIGAVFAGLVYVIIAIVVKLVGVKWINKLMPAVIIGPTVAIIGLSLAGSAINDLKTAPAGGDYRIAILCGLVTLAVTMVCSVYGKKTLKMVPFVIGILAGYVFSLILTIIGDNAGIDALKVVDLTALKDLFADIKVSTFVSFPTWDLWKDAIDGVKDLSWSYVGAIAVAYVPVAFVVFAEHIADHKNISSIIEKDLLEEPGLHRTLLGDGVGSMAGAIFGGAPNTTYGESIGCVAISGNASVITIWATAILAIIISFLSPFAAFLSTIPNCVMGGVCMALYGFIAVSGLKMVQKVDLEDNRNLFVVSVILIAGIGGLSVSFGEVNITTIALALILGILTNVLLSRKKADNNINIEEQK